MAAIAGLATLLVAALASTFMAWTIGAGSSGSTPFAPAVGANAISVLRAAFFVGILGLLGATFQGANVSEAMGEELILFPDGGSLTPIAAAVALTTAAALVAVGIYTGYPIATAFTSTGAVVGAGIALGGDPAWAKYQQIGALWVLVPFVGGGASYLTARFLRSVERDRLAVAGLAALVGVIVANVEFVLLGPPGQSRSVAGVAAAAAGTELARIGLTALLALAVAGLLYWDVGRGAERGQRHFLLALGGLVAFSAGGSQVGLAVGPLLPLLDFELVYVLAGGGVGLLVGSWTGAPRMIKALAQDYSSLGPRRSIAALIPAFAIAQSAVFFGIPVSFNEIIVSAIVGSGYAASRAGGESVSRSKMGYTVLAWVGSLALALTVSYALFLGVDTLL
jgi:PiT family inorganic phosphate transporter